MNHSIDEVYSCIEEQIQTIIQEQSDDGDSSSSMDSLHQYLQQFLDLIEHYSFSSPSTPMVSTGVESQQHTDTQLDSSPLRKQLNPPPSPAQQMIVINYFLQLLEVGYQYESIFEVIMSLWKYYPKFLKQFLCFIQEKEFSRLISLLLQYYEDGFRVVLIQQIKHAGQLPQNPRGRRRRIIEDNVEEEYGNDIDGEDEEKSFIATPSAEFEQAIRLLIFFVQRLSLTVSVGKSLLLPTIRAKCVLQLYSFYGFLRDHSIIEQYFPATQSLQSNVFQSLIKLISLQDAISFNNPQLPSRHTTAMDVVGQSEVFDVYDYLNIDVWLVFEVILNSTKEEEAPKIEYLLRGIYSFFITILSTMTENSSSIINDHNDYAIWKDWIVDVLQICLTCQSIEQTFFFREDKASLSNSRFIHLLRSWKQFLFSISSVDSQLFLLELVLVWLALHACGFHHKKTCYQHITSPFLTSSSMIQSIIETELLHSRIFLVYLLDSFEEDELSMKTFLKLLLIEIKCQSERKAWFIINSVESIQDEWIIFHLSTTIISLLQTRHGADWSTSQVNDTPPPGSEVRGFEGIRVRIILNWIEEYVTASLNLETQSFHRLSESDQEENVFFLFSQDIIVELLSKIPFATLIREYSGCQKQITALLFSVSAYFVQLNQLNQPKITTTSNATSNTTPGSLLTIPSYSTLSIAFSCMISILQSSSTMNQDTRNKTNEKQLISIIQSFQQNQVLSTLVIQQIMILLQQYNHYFEYFLRPTSKEKQKRIPLASLIKMVEFLSAEMRLFELIRGHSLSNGVKMILLKSLALIANSITHLIDQINLLATLPEGESSVVVVCMTALRLCVALGQSYFELFLQQNSLPEPQIQILLSCARSFLSVYKVFDDKNQFPYLLWNSAVLYYQAVLCPINQIIPRIENAYLKKGKQSEDSFLSRKRREDFENWKEDMPVELLFSDRLPSFLENELFVNQQFNLHE